MTTGPGLALPWGSAVPHAASTTPAPSTAQSLGTLRLFFTTGHERTINEVRNDLREPTISNLFQQVPCHRLSRSVLDRCRLSLAACRPWMFSLWVLSVPTPLWAQEAPPAPPGEVPVAPL